MVEAGILREDDRVELIRGEVMAMSPIGKRPAACVKRIVAFLGRNTDPTFILSVQDPIQLDGYNQPQPDVALLHYREDFYAQAHPTPKDILLLIEVADSSLDYDRDVKIPLYAQAQIPEVWLVDVLDETVTVYTQPQNGFFQSVQLFRKSQTISFLACCMFAVDSFFL
ncbi:Uma2 family endonuclease [Anthocerotibacter panamensis]|uniref:Uma2 family endonuclease n=1 Tax=Anthocerotibacter panamensis TaxID=2857077 RepID=UPI001C4083BB|nr:Uma2 family endonuclease [Anthocerotibacter panamensis]